jgi:hypothetical protein
MSADRLSHSLCIVIECVYHMHMRSLEHVRRVECESRARTGRSGERNGSERQDEESSSGLHCGGCSKDGRVCVGERSLLNAL